MAPDSRIATDESRNAPSWPLRLESTTTAGRMRNACRRAVPRTNQLRFVRQNNWPAEDNWTDRSRSRHQTYWASRGL